MHHLLNKFGFQVLFGADQDLPFTNDGIECRIDSAVHATILARQGEASAFDIELLHNLRDLSLNLKSEGVSRVFATTDSFGPDGRSDVSMLLRDVQNGGVRGGLVAVHAGEWDAGVIVWASGCPVIHRRTLSRKAKRKGKCTFPAMRRALRRIWKGSNVEPPIFSGMLAGNPPIVIDDQLSFVRVRGSRFDMPCPTRPPNSFRRR